VDAQAAKEYGEECCRKPASSVRGKVAEIAGKGRGRLPYAAFRAYFSLCADQCSACRAVFFIDAFCGHSCMQIVLIGAIDFRYSKYQ